MNDKIYYVVLTDNFPYHIEIEDKQYAIDLCLKRNLPHFYELNSSDPMNPKSIWKIKKTKNSYSLEEQSFFDLAMEHDRNLTNF